MGYACIYLYIFNILFTKRIAIKTDDIISICIILQDIKLFIIYQKVDMDYRVSFEDGNIYVTSTTNNKYTKSFNISLLNKIVRKNASIIKL